MAETVEVYRKEIALPLPLTWKNNLSQGWIFHSFKMFQETKKILLAHFMKKNQINRTNQVLACLILLLLEVIHLLPMQAMTDLLLMLVMTRLLLLLEEVLNLQNQMTFSQDFKTSIQWSQSILGNQRNKKKKILKKTWKKLGIFLLTLMLRIEAIILLKKSPNLNALSNNKRQWSNLHRNHLIFHSFRTTQKFKNRVKRRWNNKKRKQQILLISMNGVKMTQVQEKKRNSNFKIIHQKLGVYLINKRNKLLLKSDRKALKQINSMLSNQTC